MACLFLLSINVLVLSWRGINFPTVVSEPMVWLGLSSWRESGIWSRWQPEGAIGGVGSGDSSGKVDRRLKEILIVVDTVGGVIHKLGGAWWTHGKSYSEVEL